MSTSQNFCTLFDSNYLARALVLYHSLEDTGEDFRLYAVCFDDLAYQLLVKLDKSNFVPIPLSSFESPELLEVKSQRTAGEYCWTCTPYVIRFVLDKYNLSEVTYLDADLYFYSKPSILLEEFDQSGASVLITSHRYTPRYDKSAVYGIYCVQFMTFKADALGLNVLQWWQDRCLEWCYARVEDGKFGDQKYLDDWTQRFEGVHELKHLGGGVAPWNIQQYRVNARTPGIYINDSPLVFFHFHAYRYYIDGVHAFSPNYLLSTDAVEKLYRPYAQAILSAHAEVRNIDADFSSGFSKRGNALAESAKKVKRSILGVFNEYKIG